MHPFQWKEPSKLLLEIKNIWKFSIFKAIFLNKKWKKYLSFSNKFEMLMSVSETYFLEVTEHDSQKIWKSEIWKFSILETFF